MSRDDRRYLAEFVSIFENPEEIASKYRKFSYLWFALAFVSVVAAGVLSALKITPDLEGGLLTIGGVLIGLGILYRMGAKQIPVLVKYADFRTEEAKAALRDQ